MPVCVDHRQVSRKLSYVLGLERTLEVSDSVPSLLLCAGPNAMLENHLAAVLVRFSVKLVLV